MRKLIAIGTLATLLAACSSGPRPLYYWGDYQDQVYQYYVAPGDLATQKEAILKIIQEAKAEDLPVGPGVYGHLGLIEMQQGDIVAAREAFQKEATLYPESKQFIQFITHAKSDQKTKGRAK